MVQLVTAYAPKPMSKARATCCAPRILHARQSLILLSTQHIRGADDGLDLSRPLGLLMEPKKSPKLNWQAAVETMMPLVIGWTDVACSSRRETLATIFGHV